MHRLVPIYLCTLAGCSPDTRSYDIKMGSGSSQNGLPGQAPGTGQNPAVFECEDKSWEGRFLEESQARGLTTEVPGLKDICEFCSPIGLGLVAEDMDGDGDTDIVTGMLLDQPLLYTNDGEGHFTAVVDAFPSPPDNHFSNQDKDSGIRALGTADLDGDGLPDIVWSGVGLVGAYTNQGGGSFTEQEFLYTEEESPLGIYGAVSIADFNSDGLLDIAATSTRATGCPACPTPGGTSEDSGEDILSKWRDAVLIQEEGGGFTTDHLYTDGEGSNSHIGIATDIDADGDPDLYVPKDLNGSNSLWINGSGEPGDAPSWEDKLGDFGLDTDCKAMGFDNADIDEDGNMDFCITCLGIPMCMLSDGMGGYYSSSLALGFSVDSYDSPDPGVGWSGWLRDFNNDGRMDFVQANGASIEERDQYDLIWGGQTDGGFKEETEAAGIGDERDHYGMAAADFDGDGYLDLVAAGPGHPPVLWMNKGGDCAWLEVELPGAVGLNSRVRIVDGDRTWEREILGPSGQAQNPRSIHFGLGDRSRIDELWIQWAGEDSFQLVATDVATGQRLQLAQDN
jgi:hypothetical protein